jgi:glycerol 2-dehydrogenase (NADP+)
LKTGKVKAIGVSNFTVKNLKLLLETAQVVPAVNQIEMHPYCPQEEIRAFCKEKGIHVTAYRSLGRRKEPLLINDETVS